MGLETCAGRLFHLHLQGFKNGKDHHPPFVAGASIQWVEPFRMLRATGSSGPMDFEPLGAPRHHNTLAAVAAAPERLVQMHAETR